MLYYRYFQKHLMLPEIDCVLDYLNKSYNEYK